MLPFGVTIPATVPQGSEILEGLMNNPVLSRNLLPLFSEYKNDTIKVQLSNSEGELSVHTRMQYACFVVDLKRLRV